MVDVAPPVVGEGIDVSYNSSTDQLSVRYDARDEGGVVVTVEVALGRSPLDTDVLGWTQLVDQSDSMQGLGHGVVEVTIPDGLPVWLKLRATDGGNDVSLLCSKQ